MHELSAPDRYNRIQKTTNLNLSTFSILTCRDFNCTRLNSKYVQSTVLLIFLEEQCFRQLRSFFEKINFHCTPFKSEVFMLSPRLDLSCADTSERKKSSDEAQYKVSGDVSNVEVGLE